MILYVIRQKYTGWEYVGTTVRTARLRWSDHLSACFTKHEQSPLYADMRACGREAFDIETIAEVDDYEALLALERAEILKRRTLYPDGYNQVKGGRGNYGWKPSPDVRRNMSEGQRGRVLSEEHREKLRAHFKGRPNPKNAKPRGWTWNKGGTHSDAAKAKMSATRRGVPWTEKRHAAVDPAKMRTIGMTGQTLSAETKAKMGEAKRHWWANLTPDERRQQGEKISAGHRRDTD
jgi:hypothetical protein